MYHQFLLFYEFDVEDFREYSCDHIFLLFFALCFDFKFVCFFLQV